MIVYYYRVRTTPNRDLVGILRIETTIISLMGQNHLYVFHGFLNISCLMGIQNHLYVSSSSESHDLYDLYHGLHFSVVIVSLING